MRQKIRHLFLTFKSGLSAGEAGHHDASISGFQFAKVVDDGTFQPYAAGSMLTEKFGSEGRLTPIDAETAQKSFPGNFPLKSMPQDFDGLWVGFLVCGKEKTQLDQRDNRDWNNRVGMIPRRSVRNGY